jgi:CHAD domain-containing protein
MHDSVEEAAPKSQFSPTGVALFLFDQVQSRYALADGQRRLLERAISLVEAPLAGSKKERYPAALALVQYRLAGQFSAEQQAELAGMLALYHGLKPGRLERLGFSPQQQQTSPALAALLMVAAALGKEPVELVAREEGGFWIVTALDPPKRCQAISRAITTLETHLDLPLEAITPAYLQRLQIPFPEPTKLVGLTPDDDLAEAARKVMRFHFARMLQHEPGTRLGEDIEALHAMRVASRRLRAAFEVFESAFDPQALRPHLKGLRRTGRALGHTRDLDVFMEKAHRYLKRLPGKQAGDLAPLLEAWHTERETARAEMLLWLDSPGYLDFKRQFNAFLHTPGEGASLVASKDGSPHPNRVRWLAPLLIYTRLAAVRAYGPHLPAAPLPQLHALRIEFKKLRYTVEYFQEVLGRRSRLVIEAIKTVQDHLGDLNDADVAVALLEQFLAQHQSEATELEGVGRYLLHCQEERSRLQAGFIAVWKQTFAHASFRRSLAQAIAVL